MFPDIYNYIQIINYLLIGTLAGMSMGIVGVGAGIITIPLLIYSGLSIRSAVGVSLVMQLLPQSLPGVLIYNKKGFIPPIPSILVVTGSVIGIAIGAYMVKHDIITEKMTYQLLSIILIITAIVFSKKYLFVLD